MTQQQAGSGDDLSQQFTTPAAEWAALLTLAVQPDPARALAAGEWREAYFASAGAADAFAQLAKTAAPATLRPPAKYADVCALDDVGQLRQVREQLATLAQVRALASVQHNRGAELLKILAALGTDREAEMLRLVPQLVEASLDAVSKARDMGRAPAAPATFTLAALADRAGYWARVDEHRDAMPTGLAGLDKVLGGGFQAKRLTILLGGPGGGKSTLSNQVAEHIADTGRPVIYLTLEDSAAVMLARTVARLGNLSYGAVLQGREGQKHAIDGVLAHIAERKSAQRLLYVEDALNGGPLQPDTLRDLARAHFERFPNDGRGLLVVDYLQRWARALMSVPGEKRELRIIVSGLTERLRQIARELDCSVLCIASQNRASGYGNGGTSALATAKESGDIEYSADVVMALGTDEKRTPGASFIQARLLRVDKNRQGPVTQGAGLALDWYGDRQQFTEAAK